MRWVHASELLDPTPWLSGGEILLTTGLQLDGRGRASARSSRGWPTTAWRASGLGTGFAHDTVPEAMMEEADARGLPLFEVPYELPFIAITERAFGRLVNEQYELLRRSIAAQERLQRIVLSERGMPADRRGALDARSAGRSSCSTAGASRSRCRPSIAVARRAARRARRGRASPALRGGRRRRSSSAHPELAARAVVLPVAPTGREGSDGPAAGVARRRQGLPAG